MSKFVVLAWDVPDSASARDGARDAHFLHIGSALDRIEIAGPLRDDAGCNIGSLFVLDVDTAQEAEALLKSDPYFAAGVWERWTIHPFLAAAGRWVGGTIW